MKKLTFMKTYKMPSQNKSMYEGLNINPDLKISKSSFIIRFCMKPLYLIVG